MPKFPDCPVCVQEHGSDVKHFSSTTNSLHLTCIPGIGETSAWMVRDISWSQASECNMNTRSCWFRSFFIPVENKTGLIVSQEVFQLIDYIATCKQLQAFHGTKVLRILSGQGTEFVNKDFEKHARQRGIHIATSPAHPPQSNGVAERLVGLAKQCTRRLLPCRGTPRLTLELRNEICCRDASTQSFRISMARTSLWRRGRYVAVT